MRIFIWAVVCLLITISLKRLQTICLEGSLGMLVWDQRDFIRSDNISLVGEIYGLAVWGAAAAFVWEWVVVVTAGGGWGGGCDTSLFIVNNKLIKWLKCF